ncbi:unnamed protein product, partial [Meganyctiphanes norvegica]
MASPLQDLDGGLDSDIMGTDGTVGLDLANSSEMMVDQGFLQPVMPTHDAAHFNRTLFTLMNMNYNTTKSESLDAVSDDVQVFLVIVYSLAAFLSLAGNIIVILVLTCGRKSSVRCYLINLAISDIAMGIFCIPFSYTNLMFHRWIFLPEFCRIVTFMQHVTVTCSVYTLVAIGFDRYKALVHPLNNRWTKSRSKLVIMGIWIFSVAISIVQLVVSYSEPFTWNGEFYYKCEENWPKTPNETYEKVYTVVLFFLTFALPLPCFKIHHLTAPGMMCSYRLPGNADQSRDQNHMKAKIKVINMMIVVMVCFVLSWFPLQVFNFFVYFAPEITQCRSKERCFSYYMSAFACHWIAMANSFMNPFIYCFMSKNFREDLVSLLRRCGCCGGSRLQRQRSNAWSRSDHGSSFRSILYITHKTSMAGNSSKMSFRGRPDRSTPEHNNLELRPLQLRQRCSPQGVSESTLLPPSPSNCVPRQRYPGLRTAYSMSKSESNGIGHQHPLSYSGSKKWMFQQQQQGSTKSSSSLETRTSVIVDDPELMVSTDQLLQPTNGTSALPIHPECLSEEAYEDMDRCRVSMLNNEKVLCIDNYRTCEDREVSLDCLLDKGETFVVKKAENVDTRNDFYGVLAADNERSIVIQSPDIIKRKSSLEIITTKLKSGLLSASLKSPLSEQKSLSETLCVTCECDSLSNNTSDINGKNENGIQGKGSIKGKKKSGKKNGLITKLKLKRANSGNSRNGVVTIS